jgi:hypothetical protein
LTGEDNQPLVYPTRLGENHHEIAARYLGGLALEQRQPILDELEGRFQAEEKGMKPVYDEISFLHSLCKLMKQGKFRPNLGIKVRDWRRGEREKARVDACSGKLHQPPSETDEQRRQRRASGLKHLAEMRKLLGMRGETNNQDVGEES